MHPPPEVILAQRVTLRRVTPADSTLLYAIARDPEVMRFMDWPMPTDPAATRAALLGSFADWDAGSEYQWIILERAGGECVGTLSCRLSGRAADFGYFLGRGHWGKGFAYEAASSMLQWLHGQSAIRRIWATVDVENTRSRRLLERLGLQLESIARKATVRPNIGAPPRDTATYALTKDHT